MSLHLSGPEANQPTRACLNPSSSSLRCDEEQQRGRYRRFHRPQDGTNNVRLCLVSFSKNFGNGILVFKSTKRNLFIKFFIRMGSKSRDESKEPN